MLHYRTTYKGETIATKSGLVLAEQETGLILSAASARVSINSHNPAIIKRLLALPFFEVTEIELSGEKPEMVVGLSGSVPVGALSIKTPRKSNDLRLVVTDGRQYSGAR